MEKKDENWVMKCTYTELSGAKTWLGVVKNYMKELGLSSVDHALDHHAWKMKIVGDTC